MAYLAFQRFFYGNGMRGLTDGFVRRDDGTLESPGAWGVVWEDLCKLDYRRREVWRFMAEVFLFWCRRGVNGFRCDAGYMLPAESWDYIVAKVRREFPATVFLLEGLGGPRDKQEQLLGRSDLNWAYSELFQNYSREQIEYYQPYIARCSAEYGLLVNYAETHDNNRLAVSGPGYASMRCALCALRAEGGGFGITNGAEWFATEKVDVHGDASLNWGNPANQVKGLRRLQTLLAEHAAFAAGNPACLVTRSRTAALAALRGDGDDKVLILINLDCEKSTPVAWPVREFEAPEETALDLLSGGPVHWQRRQEEAELSLMPGQALCLTRSPERLRRLELALTQRRGEPARVRRQRLKAAALRLHCHFHGYDDFTDPALPEQLAEEFFRDHRALLRRLSGLELPPVTEYRVGRDERRNVMVPPGDLVRFTSAIPFQAEIYRGETLLTGGACLPTAAGEQVLYLALPELLSDVPAQCEVRLATFVNKGVEHHAGPLLLLPPPERVSIRMRYTEREIGREPFYALASNQVGGMSQAPAEWGALYSKYDALLAGNCNPDYPADRHVMFTRCRAWLVLNDYSQELDRNCLNSFTAGSDNKARWDFSVPVGQGQTVRLRIVLQMALDGDAMELAFIRLTGGMPLSALAVLLYFGSLALEGVLSSAQESLLVLFGQKMTHALRSEMSRKLTLLPAGTLVVQNPGEVAARFSGDVDTVEALFTSGIISMAADACRILSIMAVIAVKNTGLALILLLVLPLFAVFTRHVQKRMLAAQLDNRRAVAAVSGQVPETLHNIRTIRALGLEDYMERRYDRRIGESYAAVERTNFYDAVYSPVVLLLNAAVVGVVMLLSASGKAEILTLFGMSVGTSVTVISYISRIFAPIESLGMEIQTIQSAMAGVKRIDAFLAQPERAIPEERERAARGDVVLSHVTFGYGEKPVLTDFSMTVKQGEQVTLVGRTGAGKSTVFKLLLGLYPPESGSITIGGVDVADITDSERRACIGCVEQHFSRVPGTVLDQITLGDARITEEMAKSAARLAGIDAAIASLPEGCDTVCTGGMFSQGEWQLLSIARAAAADPAVLLLDEITANLDAETEARVLEALRRASEGRTVLSVSHRVYENLGGRTIEIRPQPA